MKEEITGAGPAFPSLPVRVTRNGEEIYAHTGMTLRDYFAAKAMQGLLTSRHTDYENGWYAEDQVAAYAYKMADAMLKERGGN